jgi:hypothetical protein
MDPVIPLFFAFDNVGLSASPTRQVPRDTVVAVLKPISDILVILLL